MDRTMLTWLAASMVTVATAASAADASHETPADIVVVAANVADRAPTVSKPLGDATVDANAKSNAVKTKPDAATIQTSEHFVLLGLAVVLVGAIARQRRRFRRSTTIMLR